MEIAGRRWDGSGRSEIEARRGRVFEGGVEEDWDICVQVCDTADHTEAM